MKGQGAHEVTYPYLNTNPKLTCPSNLTTYNTGAYVASGFVDYYCSETKLMTLVSTYGSAVSTIYASDISFGNYANGIYDGCTSKNINHAVLVVGYGTDALSGKDYWLIKNSWGTWWGINGLMKMYRGNNQCGIANFCYAAKCGETFGMTTVPPKTTLPPPLPASQTCDLSKKYPNLTGDYELVFDSKLHFFDEFNIL